MPLALSKASVFMYADELTKSIVFGKNHSLNPRPQLHLVMNNVEIEHVEVTKLLGVILNSKLSWLKTY